jgi:hypothetical protein
MKLHGQARGIFWTFCAKLRSNPGLPLANAFGVNCSDEAVPPSGVQQECDIRRHPKMLSFRFPFRWSALTGSMRRENRKQ